MKLPYYVDRGGEQVYRPPFTAAKVDFYGFLLKGDKDRMQRIICDGWLNGPMGTPGRFKMFSRFAILVFNKMDALTSINPPFNYRGVFPEKECAVWVMIEDTVEGGIYFTQPYIFVDNAYALSMGREIYGFPKALGEFDMPEDHTDPAHFAMKTMVVPKFGPNAPVSIEPFVTVARTSETKEAQELNDLRHLATLLHEAIDDGEELSRLGRNPWVDLWNHDIPMIFLKQIRAAGNPTRADYQAVTSLVCQATNWEWPKIYKADYSVDFGEFDSHPIRSDLGLAQGPITSTMSFYTKIDFWIGPGETLWSSTDTGASV